jgi:hypothetical protein
VLRSFASLYRVASASCRSSTARRFYVEGGLALTSGRFGFGLLIVPPAVRTDPQAATGRVAVCGPTLAQGSPPGPRSGRPPSSAPIARGAWPIPKPGRPPGVEPGPQLEDAASFLEPRPQVAAAGRLDPQDRAAGFDRNQVDTAETVPADALATLPKACNEPVHDAGL